MVTATPTNEVGRYKSLMKTAKEIGVSRGLITYYMRLLSITPLKFPSDVNRYVTMEDFTRMKEMRDQAIARKAANNLTHV